ncbi:hypothetical protein AC1031_017477 [Aphanomyces cochlioides]|nr:hypothetical protein AC1031_017477 [Aphanomyces cochlioides]
MSIATGGTPMETSLLMVSPAPPGVSMSSNRVVVPCKFNSCDKPAISGSDKCSFHKNRAHCSFPDCHNQVVSQKLCARHGGKKVCQAEGCTAHTRGRKFCLVHGGVVPKRFCSIEGCNKQAHSNQKCVRHGGGRYCKAPGCSFHARSGGLCRMHRSPTPSSSSMAHPLSPDSRRSRSSSSASMSEEPQTPIKTEAREPAGCVLMEPHYFPREKPEDVVRRPQVELKPRPPPLTALNLQQQQPGPQLPLSSDMLQDRSLMSMANLVHAMSMARPDGASTGLVTCKFNLCVNPVVSGSDKCSFHKNRTNCSFPNCTNQVVARNLCVRHGGRRLCQFEDCTAHRRGKKFCLKHGGEVPKRFCTVEGCQKQAHSNQRCVRHGGGRYCQAPSCSYHARAGGFCRNHASGDDVKEEDRPPIDGLLMLQMCATGEVGGSAADAPEAAKE